MTYKITLVDSTKAKYYHLCTKQHSTFQFLPMTGYQEVLPIITIFYFVI